MSPCKASVEDSIFRTADGKDENPRGGYFASGSTNSGGATVVFATSCRAASICYLRTSGFVITLEGEVGRGYRIQSATDLVQWEDWVHLTNSRPITEVQASVVPSSDQRFFRAVSP
jgi:hypothetical protein